MLPVNWKIEQQRHRANETKPCLHGSHVPNSASRTHHLRAAEMLSESRMASELLMLDVWPTTHSVGSCVINESTLVCSIRSPPIAPAGRTRRCIWRDTLCPVACHTHCHDVSVNSGKNCRTLKAVEFKPKVWVTTRPARDYISTFTAAVVHRPLTQFVPFNLGILTKLVFVGICYVLRSRNRTLMTSWRSKSQSSSLLEVHQIRSTWRSSTMWQLVTEFNLAFVNVTCFRQLAIVYTRQVLSLQTLVLFWTLNTFANRAALVFIRMRKPDVGLCYSTSICWDLQWSNVIWR